MKKLKLPKFNNLSPLESLQWYHLFNNRNYDLKVLLKNDLIRSVFAKVSQGFIDLDMAHPEFTDNTVEYIIHWKNIIDFNKQVIESLDKFDELFDAYFTSCDIYTLWNYPGFPMNIQSLENEVLDMLVSFYSEYDKEKLRALIKTTL